MIKRKLGLHHGPNTLQLPYRELGLCVPNIIAMAAATQIQAIAKALNSNDPDTAKICIATYCKLGKDVRIRLQIVVAADEIRSGIHD